jgi:hypothetical protein
MGRASRMKAESRAQRKPRTVSIYNPRTGLVEQHRVTISDRGLAEWVMDRERLAGQGYPDRPPTYDDPKVRAWGHIPGEPEFDAPCERSEERFEMSWATRHPVRGWDLKILAFKMQDGGFLVRRKVVTAEGRVEVSDGHFGAWAEVVAFAQEHIRRWASIGCPEPTVLTRRELERLVEREDLSCDHDGTIVAA